MTAATRPDQLDTLSVVLYASRSLFTTMTFQQISKNRGAGDEGIEPP